MKGVVVMVRVFVRVYVFFLSSTLPFANALSQTPPSLLPIYPFPPPHSSSNIYPLNHLPNLSLFLFPPITQS